MGYESRRKSDKCGDQDRRMVPRCANLFRNACLLFLLAGCESRELVAAPPQLVLRQPLTTAPVPLREAGED